MWSNEMGGMETWAYRDGRALPCVRCQRHVATPCVAVPRWCNTLLRVFFRPAHLEHGVI